ncbi:MAG: site-specific integrase [Rhodospirillales bacterium]|jgi:integrase|nr:site-specific integrase [Rhodospirillales bacterium]
MSNRFTKLTRIAIRKLKSGENIIEHGICAVRSINGDIRYSVNIMVDGQRVHRVIGRESEGVTRTQAEKFIEIMRTKAREGRLSLPVGRKTHMTFAQAADSYIERLEETDGKNIIVKKRQLKMHLKPFFRSQRLDNISAFSIDRYKRRRKEDGAAPGTVNRELAALSHLLNKAAEWKWIKTVPCKITLYSESRGRIIVLTDEQEDALFKAALRDQDPDCWLFVAFGLNTAMRHKEILRARYDQLDLTNKRLLIPIAKAGAREQPITSQLADILKSEREIREDRDGWIFPSPRPGASGTGYRHRMDKPFRRAVKAAGLDPDTITPHVMRHTAITKLVKAGVDLPTIQRISGHKTLDMVLRYTHVHGTHIDKAIENIGRGLPEQDGNEVTVIRPKFGTSGEQKP